MSRKPTSPTPFRRTLVRALMAPPRIGLYLVNQAIARATFDDAFPSEKRFPWLSVLASQTESMQHDLAKILDTKHSLPRLADLLPIANLYALDGDWRQLIFKINGTPIPGAADCYPAVQEALSSIPGLVSATVSVLGPHEKIAAHAHHYKGLLIFHLPILLPPPHENERCTIRCDRETRSWRMGEAFVIDPTFEHEVVNDTDHHRIVLFGEFERPGIPWYLRPMGWLFKLAFSLSPPGRKMIANARAYADAHRGILQQA